MSTRATPPLRNAARLTVSLAALRMKRKAYLHDRERMRREFIRDAAIACRNARDTLRLRDAARGPSADNASFREIAFQECPNLLGLLGTALTAKLIARAGGLQKLALLSVPRIATLGGESSFFRAQGRARAKAAQTSLLASHPSMQGVPPSKRSKAVRELAFATSLCAKADALSHEAVIDQAKQRLAARLKRL